MKKLKLGLLLISKEWGGAEEVVYNILAYLKKSNIEILLFINNDLKEHFSNLNNVNIYCLGSINKKNKFSICYNYLIMRGKLIKLLKYHKLDILHVHLETSLLIYWNLFDKFNFPVIFTLHGEELRILYKRKSIYQFIVYFILKEMLQKCKIIISPSHWQIKDLDEEYKLKTIVMPNFVDTDKFKPIHVKKEKKVVLFVGRFVKEKGVIELVTAAKELPQYEFWFVGWGPLYKIINLPNTKNLGFKTKNDLIRLYNKATICVCPSHYESFGIVGLEAMSCGSPVIATKKGFSEFIENGSQGLLIDPKNIKQLKDAIINLINNDQLRKNLGKNARRKAKQYDLEKHSNEIKKIYLNAVNKN